MHKTLKNTITGLIGGILLYAGVAKGQVDTTKITTKEKIENTITDTTNNEKEYNQKLLIPKYIFLPGVNSKVPERTGIDPSLKVNFERNSLIGFPKSGFNLDMNAYDSLKLKSNEIGDTTKTKKDGRDFIIPGTVEGARPVVADKIAGIDPFITVTNGYVKNFNNETVKNTNDQMVFEAYAHGFNGYKEDMTKRIALYHDKNGSGDARVLDQIVKDTIPRLDPTIPEHNKIIQLAIKYLNNGKGYNPKDISKSDVEGIKGVYTKAEERLLFEEAKNNLGLEEFVVYIRGKNPTESIPYAVKFQSGKGIEIIREIPGPQGNAPETTKQKPCPCDTIPPANKTTTPIKTDTIPKSEKEKTQFFIGGGAELNSYINNNELIAQYALGVKFNKWSIAALFGFNNNIEKHNEEYFPATYIDATGRKIEFGGSTLTTNTKNKIMQPGLELMFYPNKNLGIGIGMQYNIANVDTTGQIYQTVTNDVGKTRAILIPIDEKTGKLEFFTLNPTLEWKLNHVAVYVGGKFALKPEYRNPASINAGVKVFF
jgi:hypothetical protein